MLTEITKLRLLGTHENIAITISVADLLLNDTDVEGDALSLVSVSQGHHGSVVLNNNGTITFVKLLPNRTTARVAISDTT